MKTKLSAIAHKLIFPRHGEVGQSIVIMTLGILVLIAFAALVFDGGTAYAERRHMQNAADAAAMAGARAMAQSGATRCDVWAAVTNYAETRNGADGGRTEAYYLQNGNQKGNEIQKSCGPINPNVEGIAVVTHKDFNTFFAGVLGERNGDVAAEALAHFGIVSVPPPNGMQPIARRCDNPNQTDEDQFCGFQFGVQYDIWNAGEAGGFGWLDWTGSCGSTQCLIDMLNPDYTITTYNDPITNCHVVATGCWVPGNTGVSNGDAVRTAMANWLNGYLGKPMTIIIWDETTGQGQNTYYHIIGFAEFVLDSFKLQETNEIWGKFVKKTCANCGVCVQNCLIDTGYTAAGLISSVQPTPTASRTSPPTSTGSPTATPIRSPTASRTWTRTNTPNPSYTPTSTPTFTPTPTDTRTSTNTPTATNTATPTLTPTSIPSVAAIYDRKSAVYVSGSSTTPLTMAHNGEKIWYQIYVRNTGSYSLTNVTVVDNLTGANVQLTDMAPQAEANVMISYTIPYNAKNPMVNTATAQGSPPSGPAVSARSTYTVTLITPSIKLTKSNSAGAGRASVGDVVTYTFQIQNTGDTTLYNVALTDITLFPAVFSPPPCGPNTFCSSTPLTPGQVLQVQYAYTVPEIKRGTTINNTGYVNAQDILQRNVEDISSSTLIINP
jgi:uncharacterized repeat protein (TIGR01451 family)